MWPPHREHRAEDPLLADDGGVGDPDTAITLEHVFASGDQVALATTMTGTNTGLYFGKPATGRKLQSQAAARTATPVSGA
ncbi:ester cyclase [Streptomyces sp. NPDC001796]|uniref:ester cyclase n=1 Tax=Streptomyces sp. NPDC001796 TaxID=3364609 RepID=UPI0036BC2AED